MIFPFTVKLICYQQHTQGKKFTFEFSGNISNAPVHFVWHFAEVSSWHCNNH